MRKREELSNPSSCMSRAADNEMVFVLLGRDTAAPLAIKTWCDERVRQGKNAETDLQIVEAREVIRILLAEQKNASKLASQVWSEIQSSLDGTHV